MAMTPPVEGLKKADVHIHLVGSADDGCLISKSLLNSPWAKLIAYRLGLDISDTAGYVQRLINDIRASPIDIGVILATDAIYDERGEMDARTSLYIPNNYVFKVAAQYEKFRPGVSVHPNRRDALDEIERCCQAGAALVKWIPNAQHIDPADRRYQSFYRKLKDCGLPLLSHTGYEFTVKTPDQDLGDPDRLRLALEEGVTVIGAHCGISYGGLSIKYHRRWLSMLKEYPNLYGDLAALSLGFGTRLIRKLLNDETTCQRLVNGSDFPVPPARKIRDLFTPGNIFALDYRIKKEFGVPDSVFYRGYQLIRKK